MAHCVSFYRKWKEEPNFCGLGKTTVEVIDQYMEIVEELVGYGISEIECYRLFPSSNINHGFKQLKHDSQIRKEIITKIISSISSGKKVTSHDIWNWSKYKSITEEEVLNNYTIEGIKGWRHSQKIMTPRRNRWEQEHQKHEDEMKERAVKREKEIKELSKHPICQIDTPIEKRISVLNDIVLSTGQKGILLTIITSGFAEDEYGALCVGFKWISERLEEENKKREDLLNDNR